MRSGLKFLHNRNDVAKALKLLSTHFKIRTPDLIWKENRVQSFAYCYLNEIRMGARSPHILTDILLHEFTHFIVFEKTRTHYHRDPFPACLYEVASWWYDLPEEYDWTTEYLCIKKWYAKEKL